MSEKEAKTIAGQEAAGMILGAGFLTVIPFIGYYLMLLSCIMIADPLHGSIVMGFFGAARAVPVILTPLFWWTFRYPPSLNMTAEANQWFTEVITRLGWLRVPVLFAVAGSALVAVLG
jgi:hypothetical protein